MTGEPAPREPSQGSEELRRKWLLTLGLLTAGKMPVDEAKARVAAYASLLDDYPDEVFSRQNLKLAAGTFKWFPSFAELTDLLWETRESQAHQKRESDRIALKYSHLRALPAPEPGR